MPRRSKHYCSGSECPVRWKNVISTGGACESCGAPLRKLHKVNAKELARVAVYGDIPAHFNPSTNCVITGRRHLQQVQAAKGLSDYDPKSHSGPPTNWE